jgi:transposase-like protein
MKKKIQRRSFTVEFKQAAVAKVREGAPVPFVAKEIEVAESVLRRWLAQAPIGNTAKADPTASTPTRAATKRSSSRSGISPEQQAQAVAELIAGGRVAVISAKYGVTDSGLRYWAKKLGHVPRAKGNGRSTPLPAQDKGALAATEVARANRDALILLRRAKGALIEGLREGTIDDLGEPHLLALLALQALQGG